MLYPKKTKYRKQQKGRIGGIKPNTTSLSFGSFGIKSLKCCRITAKNIEAVRRTLVRTFKRGGRMWIRIFPDLPVTAKPAEVRMGKGKGAVSYWSTRIEAGQILFEFDGVSAHIAQEAVTKAAYKLPVPVALVTVR